MGSIIKKSKRWTFGIVPYVFDPFDFPNARTNKNIRAGIEEAIDDWNGRGLKVRFKERRIEPSFLFFKINRFTGSGGSESGMLHGIQVVWASDNDSDKKLVKALMLHELGHALGLSHEFCRNDRNDYIKIDWSNIEHIPLTKYYENQLEINPDARDHGGYDFKSIMHYGSFAYAKDDSKPVITKKDGSLIPTPQELTNGDVAAIKELYEDIEDDTGVPIPRKDEIWGDSHRIISLPSITVGPPTVHVSPPRINVNPPPLTFAPPPITVNPPPLTVNPPPLTVDPPELTVTPPKMHVSPPPIKVMGKKYSVPSFDVQPPSMTVDPPTMTVTPPAMTVTPPEMTVNPPAVTVNPPEICVKPPEITIDPPAFRVALPRIHI